MNAVWKCGFLVRKYWEIQVNWTRLAAFDLFTVRKKQIPQISFLLIYFCRILWLFFDLICSANREAATCVFFAHCHFIVIEDYQMKCCNGCIDNIGNIWQFSVAFPLVCFSVNWFWRESPTECDMCTLMVFTPQFYKQLLHMLKGMFMQKK